MPSAAPESPRPIEIGRANEHDIKIRWNDGKEAVYPARLLRLECPCANCVDELTGHKRIQDANISADVHPAGIERVGRYAIQIFWSDGHQTGIYTWERLYDLMQKLTNA